MPEDRNSIPWWHQLKPHRLLQYVPRHTAEELNELEKRVRAAGRVREPIRLVSTQTGERQIVDGLGRWEVSIRSGIEPEFEDLGREEEVDVAAAMLDYGTRRDISAGQKVQMYLDLQGHSDRWMQDRQQAAERANAARSASARAQRRECAGHFGAMPAGAVSRETRTATRERDRIAQATGTSPATVSRVLATRRDESAPRPKWRKLRSALKAAMKSIESASELAAEMNKSEVADELHKLMEHAHLVTANLEAEFARRETRANGRNELNRTFGSEHPGTGSA